jgi:hypothetical protein
VEGSTRVSDPLGAGRRCQAHGAEGLSQGRLVPPPRPTRRLARWTRWSPGGRSPGRGGRRSTSEHGGGSTLAPTPWPLKRPHGDAP